MEDLIKSMQIQATVFFSVLYGFSLESSWFPRVKFFGNQINEIGKLTYLLVLHSTFTDFLTTLKKAFR